MANRYCRLESSRTSDTSTSDDEDSDTMCKPEPKKPKLVENRDSSTLKLHFSSPEKLCWRCGLPGHTRSSCHGPQILFCSRCGRLGILSRLCPCQAWPKKDVATQTTGMDPPCPICRYQRGLLSKH